MELHIKNSSHYRTEDLRKILRAAIKAEGAGPFRYYWAEFITSRSHSRVTGLGTMNGCWQRIGIPMRENVRDTHGDYCLEPLDRLPAFEVKRVAQVIVHELGHNMGLGHREMVRSCEIDVSWAEGMDIRLKKPMPAKKKAALRRKTKADLIRRAEMRVTYAAIQKCRELGCSYQWDRQAREIIIDYPADKEDQEHRTGLVCTDWADVLDRLSHVELQEAL